MELGRTPSQGKTGTYTSMRNQEGWMKAWFCECHRLDGAWWEGSTRFL